MECVDAHSTLCPKNLEGKSGTAPTGGGADDEQHQIGAMGDGLLTGLMITKLGAGREPTSRGCWVGSA